MDEVVDLRYSDVDLNPQYSDSIDLELLAVHLMFETNPSLISLQNNTNYAELNARKQMLLPPYPKMGIEAFEAGLDEVWFYGCLFLRLDFLFLFFFRFLNIIVLYRILKFFLSWFIKDMKKSMF